MTLIHANPPINVDLQATQETPSSAPPTAGTLGRPEVGPQPSTTATPIPPDDEHVNTLCYAVNQMITQLAPEAGPNSREAIRDAVLIFLQTTSGAPVTQRDVIRMVQTQGLNALVQPVNNQDNQEVYSVNMGCNTQ